VHISGIFTLVLLHAYITNLSCNISWNKDSFGLPDVASIAAAAAAADEVNTSPLEPLQSGKN
jgi:hypothetical protein